MGFWAALGGAAATVAPFYSAYSAAESQRDANTANAQLNDMNIAVNREEAQMNRDFQERMSNSAWQRGVMDMRKAGINPMAAYSSGGASAPSGAVGTVGSTHGYQPVPSMFTQGLSTATELFKTFAQLSKDKATIVNVDTDTEKKKQERLTSSAEEAFIRAGIRGRTAESDINTLRGKFWTDYPRMNVWSDFLGGPSQIFNSAVKAFIANKVMGGYPGVVGRGIGSSIRNWYNRPRGFGPNH